MSLTITKEKQFLVFTRFIDGKYKTVKFDLAEKIYYGTSSKQVKNIKTFLANLDKESVIASLEKSVPGMYRIIKSFTNVHSNRLSNLGSIIEYYIDSGYYRLEPYAAAGIPFDYLRAHYNIDKSVARLDKLTKPHRKYLSQFESNHDTGNLNIPTVVRKLLFDIDEDMFHQITINVPPSELYIWCQHFNLFTYRLSNMSSLVSEFGYDPKALLNNIRYYIKNEFMDCEEIFSNLYDLQSMIKQLKDLNFPVKNYNRYPESLIRIHDDIAFQFKTIKDSRKKELFTNVMNRKHNLNLAYRSNKHGITIVVPTSIEQITVEAIQQSNCVKSYVDRIIREECVVVFARYTDDIENSLLTIEVRGNKVVQVKGIKNRSANTSEKAFVSQWCDARNLILA